MTTPTTVTDWRGVKAPRRPNPEAGELAVRSSYMISPPPPPPPPKTRLERHRDAVAEIRAQLEAGAPDRDVLAAVVDLLDKLVDVAHGR